MGHRDLSAIGFYLVRDGTEPFDAQETDANGTCTGNVNHAYAILDNTGLHDVKMTITLGAKGVATAQVEIDGMLQTPVTTVNEAVISSTLSLSVGGSAVRNVATNATWTVTYDDLYVDID